MVQRAMLHKILIPIDDDEIVERVLDVAAVVAGSAESPPAVEGLYVVSVAGPTASFWQRLAGMMGVEPIAVPGEVERWFFERGERLVADAVERFEREGLKLDGRIVQGRALDEVTRRAAGVDLMIVGVGEERGVAISGQGHLPISHLLRSVEATVLLVTPTPLSFKGITLAFDGSRGAYCALRSTGRLASMVGCPVQVVRVDDGRGEPGPELAEAVERLAGIGVEASGKLLQGEPAEAILAAAQEAGHDLLSVGGRRRIALGGGVIGRVTEALVDDLGLAVMVSR